MSNKILMNLRELHKAKNYDFSFAHRTFNNIMIDEFLNEFIDRNKYRVKASVGQTNMSFNWWASICDKEFYLKMYGIDDKRKVSAAVGYYIAYLFNDDNTKMYLCINQASQGINKKDNSELKEFRREINKYLLEQISYPQECLTNIYGKLTKKNNNDKALAYEEGTFLALEYDLFNVNYDDQIFKKDLETFLKIFTSLTKILLKKYVDIDDKRYDFVNRVIIKREKLLSVSSINSVYPEETLNENVSYEEIFNEINSKLNLSKEELKKINKRPPEFKKINNSKRLKTNPTLIKYVLEKCNYKCQACGTDTTFMTPKGVMYMEGHHLIPVSLQTKYIFYDYNLDNTDNIVCLCPRCHKAVHYGTYEEIINRLVPLYEVSNMKNVLRKLKIAETFEDFLSLYCK